MIPPTVLADRPLHPSWLEAALPRSRREAVAISDPFEDYHWEHDRGVPVNNEDLGPSNSGDPLIALGIIPSYGAAAGRGDQQSTSTSGGRGQEAGGSMC